MIRRKHFPQNTAPQKTRDIVSEWQHSVKIRSEDFTNMKQELKACCDSSWESLELLRNPLKNVMLFYSNYMNTITTHVSSSQEDRSMNDLFRPHDCFRPPSRYGKERSIL
jgi:hypothetical protein